MKLLLTISGLNDSLALLKKNLFLCGIALVLLTNTVFSQTLWSEDWEGNWTANWHVDGGTWEVGTPTSGPDSAFDGLKCAATVLAGNYSEPVQTRLIRHTYFTVPPASENPRLRFWYWFNFASPSDWGEVQIKTFYGDWEPISNMLNFQGGNVWSYGSIDLSNYADSTVQIAFYFQSVNDYGGPIDVSSGWYIDDVSLVTGSYTFNDPEGFEMGIGDWSVDEGTWEVGIPTSGPDSAYDGQNCAGTNLSGNYQDTSDTRLISPPFLVPSASKIPGFSFWHWFSFSSPSDWGQIQISTDGEATWQDISDKFTNTSSGVWSPFYISLFSYADSTVQIAFHFHSTNDYGGPIDVSSGWYVDNIVITPTIVNVKNNFGNKIPSHFQLSQNYPNPFNPKTKIAYSIPKTGNVSLKVFDLLGREVATLVNDDKHAGKYEVEFNASSLASGIYFYELKSNNFTEVKKMILLK